MPDRRVVLASLGIFLLMPTGCGSRLALHAVAGTVTLDGKPLGGVVVSFQPASGPAALGQTDAVGRYDLFTPGRGRGAVAGRHAIWIEVTTAGDDAASVETAVPTERKPVANIPENYRDPATSGLNATVSVGQNEVDLTLVSGDASRREK